MRVIALLVGLGACASHTSAAAPPADAGADQQTTPDATDGDGGAAQDASADVDKSATCAASFGSSLTDAFGRVDGTVLAVVPPDDQACAAPNRTHLVIQVVVAGAAYRMVVDVLSSFGNPDVFFAELDAPLAAGAWSEGWHPGVMLDYLTTLGVHSPAFTEMKEADLVAKVTSEIDLGAKISVFATSMTEHDSAHLVHRNATNADGAIVLRPDSPSPHYLLFRFAEQSF